MPGMLVVKPANTLKSTLFNFSTAAVYSIRTCLIRLINNIDSGPSLEPIPPSINNCILVHLPQTHPHYSGKSLADVVL